MITVSTKHFGGLVRHLAVKGHPACGANPEGAFVVERLSDISCPDCILLMGTVATIKRMAS